MITGDVTAASLPCPGPHDWETFAIAILPTAVQTHDQNIVQAGASVRAVCSMPVLLTSRLGRRVERLLGERRDDRLGGLEAAATRPGAPGTTTCPASSAAVMSMSAPSQPARRRPGYQKRITAAHPVSRRTKGRIKHGEQLPEQRVLHIRH